MKKLLMMLVVSLACAGFGFSQSQENIGDTANGSIVQPGNKGWFGPTGTILHDNGSLVNGSATGVGGADESILQSVSLGHGTLGFGHAVSSSFRIADELTVTGTSWQIDEITFFAYQTGSPTTSSITAVNLRIWDGNPGDPGSSVVWGDDSTNILSSTAWSGIYRVTETSTGANTDRPIMANTVSVNTALTAGTYYLDWQVDGSLGSGPWAPPVTLAGTGSTGNGLQFDPGGSVWNPAVDGNTNDAQGFPFIVTGTDLTAAVPTLGEWGMIAFITLLLAAGVVYMRRNRISAV